MGATGAGSGWERRALHRRKMQVEPKDFSENHAMPESSANAP